MEAKEKIAWSQVNTAYTFYPIASGTVMVQNNGTYADT
jgi:hypothetical protein